MFDIENKIISFCHSDGLSLFRQRSFYTHTHASNPLLLAANLPSFYYVIFDSCQRAENRTLASFEYVKIHHLYMIVYWNWLSAAESLFFPELTKMNIKIDATVCRVCLKSRSNGNHDLFTGDTLEKFCFATLVQVNWIVGDALLRSIE